MKKILIAGAMTLLMLCPAKAQIAWQPGGARRLERRGRHS